MVWREDGRELYFMDSEPDLKVMAVDISTSSGVQAGAPRVLFHVPGDAQGDSGRRGTSVGMASGSCSFCRRRPPRLSSRRTHHGRSRAPMDTLVLRDQSALPRREATFERDAVM